MSRHRLPVLAGAVALLLVAGGLLWWKPWDDGWVTTPACEELLSAFPAGDGSYVVQEAWSREVNTSNTTCVFGLSSPDRRFTGTVRVFLVGSTDEGYLDREMELGRCFGQPDPVVSTVRPRLSKACIQVVNGSALAGMYAVVGDRFAAVNTSLEGSSAPQADLVAYAQSVRAHVVDQALTLPADG
jgi:hypothetical protein